MRTAARFSLVILAAVAGGALFSPAALSLNPLTSALYEKALERFAGGECQGGPIPQGGWAIPLCAAPSWFYTAQRASMLLGGGLLGLLTRLATRKVNEPPRSGL